MIWLILSLVAGAALYLALNKQQLSSTAVMTLAGVVAAIIGVLLFVMVKQAGLRAPGDDDAAVTGVELRDIDVGLDPLFSDNPPEFFKITGWVRNGRTVGALTTLRLRVRMQKCPAAAGQDCETVADETTTFRIDVPPEQTRALSQTVAIRNAPTINSPRWQVDVVGAEFR